MRIAAAALGFVLAVSVAAPASARVPIVLRPQGPPVVGAEAWLIWDEGAGVTLASHNAAQLRPMASVTKLMTALVAVEHTSPDDLVTISERAAGTGEAGIGLVAGEVWSMRELLHAMLVRSGNDAAVAVAEHVGGTVEGFVVMMNEKAAELGLVDTSYANPHGLDDDLHYTTALDLLQLARTAMANPLIERTVRTRVVKFRPDPSGRLRRATNTNHLLGFYPGVQGIKTGFTGDAGRVLVSTAQRGNRRLYAVVMGATDHFADSRALLQYGFDSLGPSDLLLAALGMQQGDGGLTAPAPDLPDWMATRLGAVRALDDGSSNRTPLFSTPLGKAVEARLASLIPEDGDTVSDPFVEILTEAVIADRVAELGSALTADLVGRDPILIGVLHGSLPFLTDLSRHLPTNVELDFMALTRFGNEGRVAIAMDTSTSVEGRDVVIVENIVDTGLTLATLRKLFEARSVASLSVVALIDKTRRRIVDVPLEYRGFEVGDEFLLGYGFDWEGKYRNLRSLWAVLDLASFQEDPGALARSVFDGAE